MTAFVRGPTMPAIVRFAQLSADPSEQQEQRLAEQVATRAGLAALDGRAAGMGIDGAVVDSGARR